MKGIIVVTGLEAATATDLLQGTRLQTVPSNGILTFELSADLNTAAANFVATIQLPNGDTPLNGVLVPASAVIGMIDDRNKMQVQFPTGQGGHVVFSCVEVGTAVFVWRVTFTPARTPR